MESQPIAPQKSPPKVFLASVGVSALLMLVFLLIPFGTLFSGVWSVVVGIADWALVHPKKFFAIGAFLVLAGLIAEGALEEYSPKPRRWLTASRVLAAIGGGCVAVLAISALSTSPLARASTASEAFKAVEKTQERLVAQVSEEVKGDDLVKNLPLRKHEVSMFVSDYVVLWEASLQGSHVVLERSEPVRACRRLVGLLEGYQVQVNGQPAGPGSCDRGWDNTILVSLPVPGDSVQATVAP